MFYDFKFETKYLKLFENIGIDVERVLKDAGIPSKAFENDKYLLDNDQYKSILKVFDEEINKDLIVEFSKIDTTVMFVPEFYAGLCADNGLNCINRIAKYKKIIAPVDMIVETNEYTTSISYIYNDGDQIPFAMKINAYVNILSIIRQGTGIKDIKPMVLYSESEYPESAVEYIGITPEISRENKIVFNNEDLLKPFITKNNHMWDYLEKELNQRLRETEVDHSFSATVRRMLFDLIPGGASNMEKVSSELGMSKRTLQRRLNDEGTTFNEQLNHTRELLVRNYLKTDMSLDEIAFLVNYLDVNSLSRAFKTWTGMSVTEYRTKYA